MFDTDVKTVDQHYHHDGEQLNFLSKSTTYQNTG